jgi:hypothetical protein
MVYFQTKNSILGKLWRILQWKILVYVMAIWSILHHFDIYCGHLVYFVVIWYIFPLFGMPHPKKSGNPAPGLKQKETSVCSLVRKWEGGQQKEKKWA